MLWRILPLAFAATLLMQGAALAADDGDVNPQNMPDKIREKLAEKGFKDIKVVPGSFIVSAKDKEGNPVMMLIGPGQMTVLSGKPDNNDPSIAETPKGEIYNE